jgi:hypothetical protein
MTEMRISKLAEVLRLGFIKEDFSQFKSLKLGSRVIHV